MFIPKLVRVSVITNGSLGVSMSELFNIICKYHLVVLAANSSYIGSKSQGKFPAVIYKQMKLEGNM